MTQFALLAFLAFIGWAVIYYLHWVVVLRRLVMISRGRLYQSGAMHPKQLIRLSRRHGIQTVIDFRGGLEHPLVEREARALTGTGIRHVNIPVGNLPNEKDLLRFHQVMMEELAARRPVLLHCKDGQGRAVAFAAIYRVQFEGWTPLAAYRGATRLPPAFRFTNRLFPSAGLLSPRNRKTQLILGYRPMALERAGSAPVPAFEAARSAA